MGWREREEINQTIVVVKVFVQKFGEWDFVLAQILKPFLVHRRWGYGIEGVE